MPNFEDKVRIIDFNVGNSVAVKYVSPCSATGKVRIILADDCDNLVLNIGIRYYENTFILNTNKGGHWGSEVRPSGFNFTHSIVTVKATDQYFEIYQNDLFLATFNHRLPVNTVKKVSVFMAHGAAKLRSIGVGYSD